MFEKIVSVEALPDLRLKARFADGALRIYDVKPLLDKLPAFKALATTPGLFEQVHPAVTGSGIIWNEDLDLASEEVWTHGKPVAEGEGASRAVV